MKRTIPTIMAITFATSTLAFSPLATAQTTPPAAPAPAAPAARDATPPPASIEKRSAHKLTDEQAKSWINKVVYSSDNKNVGEVAAFNRDTAGNVVELHADIGGFLGIGETRVRVMPDQFQFASDRVTLNLTSDQVKALPKLAK